MGTDNRIVRTEFTRLPKGGSPREDWASVDLAAGPRQIVVTGHALNRGGDSRHQFCPSEVSLKSKGTQDQLRVEMRITEEDPGEQLIITGPDIYYYRLLVEFSEHIPAEYTIKHLNERGETQLDTKEVLFDNPVTYDPLDYLEE